jgi:hypothetical protein
MIQSKGEKPKRHAARTGEIGNAYNTLVGKAEKKNLLERNWGKWENILVLKVILKK